MDHISNVFKAIGKTKVAEIRNVFEILKLPSPFIPLYLQIKFKPSLNPRIRKLSIPCDLDEEKWRLGSLILFGCIIDCNLNFVTEGEGLINLKIEIYA